MVLYGIGWPVRGVRRSLARSSASCQSSSWRGAGVDPKWRRCSSVRKLIYYENSLILGPLSGRVSASGDWMNLARDTVRRQRLVGVVSYHFQGVFFVRPPVRSFVCEYTNTHIYIYIYIYICVCVCVCVFRFICWRVVWNQLIQTVLNILHCCTLHAEGTTRYTHARTHVRTQRSTSSFCQCRELALYPLYLNRWFSTLSFRNNAADFIKRQRNHWIDCRGRSNRVVYSCYVHLTGWQRQLCRFEVDEWPRNVIYKFSEAQTVVGCRLATWKSFVIGRIN